MNNNLPYIFILDIDNTIIGNVNNCIGESIILNYIFKYCKINNIIANCDKKLDIINELNEGLLRPYFIDFINFIKSKYKNIEIYLYTNSAYSWINNSGFIDNIEKIVKIKFNKPYFTRENALDRQKLLGNIYDDIIKLLIKKYPLLKLNENKKKVFDSQLVFIDDIPNNLKDYPDKQIICPEYIYKPYYNIKEKIIKKYNINPEIFNNKEILKIFENYDMPIYNENGSIYQKDIEFFQLSEILFIRHSELLNNEAIKDTFFKDLITILDKNKKTIRKFDNIPQINKELNDLRKSIKNRHYKPIKPL
jgi:hypothetical protein